MWQGDRKNQYTSFVEYFEVEFYNLTGTSKSELISILKAILDNDSIAIDEKQTLKSAEILYTEDKYVDCANRCYYAMMFALKTLLEHQGKLANWKAILFEGRNNISIEVLCLISIDFHRLYIIAC